MSEEEFQEATEQKISEFDSNIVSLTSGLERALKNVRYCREACRIVSKEIGELSLSKEKL